MQTATNEEERIPLAFFVTFRAYGTWLHGDERGSVDRFHNQYGTPRVPANPLRERYNRSLMTHPPVHMNASKRAIVEDAIRETCKIRNWYLWAVNARSNHVHSVVSANCEGDKVRSTLKANATRKLRESGQWFRNKTPWADRGSVRRLWTLRSVN